MNHLVILKKKWLAKILSGEKTIESRWYKHRKKPYKSINTGDIVYFKETGKPVSARVVVKKALFFKDLDENKIREILREYGREIGVNEVDDELLNVNELSSKNFCTLIFLKDVQKIKPFHIDKKGHGMMTAWISVRDINELKL